MDKVEIVKKHILSFPELKPKKKGRINDPSKIGVWERNEARKDELRQIKITPDGKLIGGSQFRMLEISGIKNNTGEDWFVLKEDHDFPPYEKILNVPNYSEIRFKFVVNELVKMIGIVSKAVKVTKITIKNGKIIFEPSSCRSDLIEPTFVKASTDLFRSTVSDDITFKVNTSYLLGVFQLAKQLKISMIELSYTNTVRPLYFVGVDDPSFKYVFAPVK